MSSPKKARIVPVVLLVVAGLLFGPSLLQPLTPSSANPQDAISRNDQGDGSTGRDPLSAGKSQKGEIRTKRDKSEKPVRGNPHTTTTQAPLTTTTESMSTTTSSIPPTSTTSTAQATTTSTAQATTTTTNAQNPPPSAGAAEGRIRLLVNAKSAFDRWTEAPNVSQQEQMQALYEWMVVWSPYFDDRLRWYENGLAYIDLYAIYTNLDKDTRSVTNPEWILKDAHGNRLFIDWGCSGGTCPQWAADVSHPAFRENFLDRIGGLLASGYPGIMIDDVNLNWRISDGNGGSVIPIDPRTGEEMLLSDWRRYVTELVENVRAQFPGAAIMHNAIWYADSPDFTNTWVRRQTASADWIMLERGIMDGGLKGGDGKFAVSTFLKFIDMAHSVGTGVLLLDESASTLDEHEYNLASYLLISNGADLLSTEDYDLIAYDRIWPGYLVDLGDALGSRYETSGLIRRDFTGGMVLLGDPGFDSTMVDLGLEYRDLNGNLVTSIRIGPKSAAVLFRP